MKNHERIRLFQSDFLERLSVVHPVIPSLIYIPLLAYFFIHTPLEFISIFSVLFGIIVWSITEYLLHRFIFHLPINAIWAKKISYIIHGIHHRDPRDPLRLVAPPIMSVSIGLAFMYFFYTLLPSNWFYGFMFGFISGYLYYDNLHWIVHHTKLNNGFISTLRNNHIIHHSKGSQKNFGVSSPLWDYIFRSYKPH